MSWIWLMPNGAIEMCPWSIFFDWRQDGAEVPDAWRAACEMYGVSWLERLREFHDKSRFAHQSFDVLAAEERRFGHVPCALLTSFGPTG